MASITSLTGSSSTSSIYGTRNVISGLASGLDTEQLIENAVKGYQNKITSLKQQQEMVQWKQEAYRSIIDKMVAMTRKYTSYTSGTNLMSTSFFNNAVKTSALGSNASKVAASGRTSSDIQINQISQLAKAAKYTVDVGQTALSGGAGVTQGNKITVGSEAIDLGGKTQVSTMTGSMAIKYGSSTAYVNFGELDAYETAEDLKKGIQDKLSDTYIRNGAGKYVKASELIDVKLQDGEISFADKSGANNSVYVSKADKSVAQALGIEESGETYRFSAPADGALVEEKSTWEYLAGREMNVTLDGVTKTIKVGRTNYDGGVSDLDENSTMEDLASCIQKQLDEAFGEGKITVGASGDGGKKGGLNFTVDKGSALSVTSGVGEAIGTGKNGISSYLNTNKTLGELLGEDRFKIADGETVDDTYKDVDGYKKLTLTINGKEMTFGKDATLSTVLNTINGSDSTGVNMVYSQMTNSFSITAKETGANSKVDMSGDLADMFGFQADGSRTKDDAGAEIGKMEAGVDAKLKVTVNGQSMELTRSSNEVSLDGLTVTLKDTFDATKGTDGVENDPITFESAADADKIIDAIQSFVDDYNELVTEIRTQYATMPTEKSSSDHSRYMPLTDEDRAGMSESAIAAYEEKAKQGILFGSSELSRLYDQMRTVVTMTGNSDDPNDVGSLSKIGITTSYSNYLTTLELDVDKLRSALESNPDSVRDAFSKSTESGASSDGLMYRMKEVLDSYAGTTTGSLGVLVSKAGSTYAPSSINSNELQTEYDSFTTQIEKWQDKMSDRVDYYTKQFTALEQLMSQMNNQSSMLYSLMGQSQ